MFYQAISISDYTPETPEGYLEFKKDDILNIQIFYENGWAYGHHVD